MLFVILYRSESDSCVCQTPRDHTGPCGQFRRSTKGTIWKSREGIQKLREKEAILDKELANQWIWTGQFKFYEKWKNHIEPMKWFSRTCRWADHFGGKKWSRCCAKRGNCLWQSRQAGSLLGWKENTLPLIWLQWNSAFSWPSVSQLQTSWYL